LNDALNFGVERFPSLSEQVQITILSKPEFLTRVSDRRTSESRERERRERQRQRQRVSECVSEREEGGRETETETETDRDRDRDRDRERDGDKERGGKGGCAFRNHLFLTNSFLS